MYLIEIGITRIKTETEIIQQMREGNKLPLIQEYESKRWIYLNAEQISTITVIEDDQELPPNQIVQDVVSTTLNSLGRLFAPKEDRLIIEAENKEADE